MSEHRLRILCVVICNTINKLDPEFLKSTFKVKEDKRLAREQQKLNLDIPEWNQVTFESKKV